jgi:glutathione-regulated potassium-efflux system ancillary protein KefG
VKKTLVILSHPNIDKSKYNKALIDGIKDLEHITIRHIEDIYGYDTKAFDIELEQKYLLEHDRVVFQFPWYWYSSPAMLKAYQDEVFSYGFAYGASGDKLNKKEFKIATTVGAPEYSYQAGGWNQNSMNELLKPFISMANLTGMVYTRAFKVHGVAAMSDDELKEEVQKYKQELLDDSWDNGLSKYIRKIDENSVKAK